MKINISKTDKNIRILLGLLVALAGIVFQSWWGIAGVVLILTGVINWCPIYALLGINTFLPRVKKDHGA